MLPRYGATRTFRRVRFPYAKVVNRWCSVRVGLTFESDENKNSLRGSLAGHKLLRWGEASRCSNTHEFAPMPDDTQGSDNRGAGDSTPMPVALVRGAMAHGRTSRNRVTEGNHGIIVKTQK
jgi:hypothetical protein